MRTYFRLLVLVAAAGCSNNLDSSPGVRDRAALAAAAPPPPADGRTAELVMASSARRAPAPQSVERKLIRSANLRIEVKHVDSAMRLIDAAVRTREALVADARFSQTPDTRRDAVVSINVPASRFDETLADLRRVGTVRNENVSTEDVTRAYTDLEIRLAVKEQTVARLRSLLGSHTAKLSDVLDLERELGRSIAELEQMKGERRYYDHEVAMASISLTLFEPMIVGHPQIAEPITVALRRSLEVLGSSVAAVIYLVTFLIPWIALVGILWWTLVRLGVRWPIRNGRHILHS